MKSPDSPPTLEDVARLAGVSYQTVSRVINNMPNVAPYTLEKVRKAIEELNYRPNRAARSLVTGRSHAIHVLVCDKYNVRTIPSMEEAAYTEGYQLRLTTLHETYSVPELRQKLSEIIASQVDGLLLVMPWRGTSYAELLKIAAGTPVVIVGCSMGYETNSVLIDQEYGMKQVVQHLLELGHRQFAEISGTVDKYEDARIRHEVLRELLGANGLKPVWSAGGNFTMDVGYEITRRMLADREKSPFTALVCANDETALGAIHAIHEVGLRVPQDISVTGFDDMDFSRHCTPPLTTVQQDYRSLGINAVQHLLSLIENPRSAPHQRIIFSKLIVRESTAPPAQK